MAAVRAFLFAASLCALGLAQDTSAQTFADVLAYIQCDRVRRGIDKLQWSDELAQAATGSPPNAAEPTARWSVTWSGANMLESFQNHFLASESTYEGTSESPPREDYMAIVWSSARTIGCSTTSSGYVCVVEAFRRSPFFGRSDVLVRRRWLTQEAACSEDSLCPIHGEEPEPCEAAGCSHEPGWTWCERPNKQQDKGSVKATFANVIATLNCERKKRGAYPAHWDDRAVDWAFNLRAAPADSAYEHSFVRGSRSWDIAWSGDDASQSFETFLSAAASAYESGEANSLSYDYMVLMSRITIFMGCYKAGDSNACVVRLYLPVAEDAQLPASSDADCDTDTSRSELAEVEGPFAAVVDHINCQRARQYHDKLQWSEDLAELASSAFESGFVGDDETRWSVAWSGEDLLDGFTDHFGNSESAYRGQATSTPPEDYMAMIWKSGMKIGCSMTMSGAFAYVCVFDTWKYSPFLGRNSSNVRQSFLTEKAACSQDRLCPVHGEEEESACLAASCSWEPGWTWCERPNKEQDAASLKDTFADMLDILNCERKKRGAYPRHWSDRTADWAFKLRAAETPSEYEHAFHLGGRSWDVAWSGDNVAESFSAYLQAAESAYENPTPETSSLRHDYLALMSKISASIGCYKAGESNACVLRLYHPLTDDSEIGPSSGADCEEGSARSEMTHIEGPFADVVDHINCARSRSYNDKLQWSEALADLASSSPEPGYIGGDGTRWSVAWSGEDLAQGFKDFFSNSESAYTGETTSTSPEDFMAMIWRAGRTIGCSMTLAGADAYVCVLESSPRNPFLMGHPINLRQYFLTEKAACSQDRLCPVHGEEEESACVAASCSWESGWTWCERPNKQQDKDSVRATFANMMATLNCERKKRGAYGAYWRDRSVDWAFKLRAANTPSEYEHAYLLGGRSWDIAWSGDDVEDSFSTFLSAAESAYENPTPETSALRRDYIALMSKASLFVGCYKSGSSNACVLSLYYPFTEDLPIAESSGADCSEDSSRSDELEVPFAGVMDYLNCARARRFHDKLDWSDDLAQLASSGPEPGFVGGDESRWSVAWSGDDLLAGFKDHFDNSESAYAGQNTSTPKEDFMVMVWKGAKKVGCELTMEGDNVFVCVFEGLKQVPFLSKNDTNVRELLLTEKAACSQDRLCPVHGELDEMSCMAASCSWESGWTWCERPNKADDSMKKTFEGILAPLNCEREQRGAYPLTWDERNADWAFKLRAANTPSEYEHAFLRGYYRDFAWSDDDVVTGLDKFMQEIESAYEQPDGATSSMSDTFKALMSKAAFKIGCFKSGTSNACVLRFNAAFNPEDAAEVGERGDGDCSREGLEKLRMPETSDGSDVDMMLSSRGSGRLCGVGSVLALLLYGAAGLQQG